MTVSCCAIRYFTFYLTFLLAFYLLHSVLFCLFDDLMLCIAFRGVNPLGIGEAFYQILGGVVKATFCPEIKLFELQIHKYDIQVLQNVFLTSHKCTQSLAKLSTDPCGQIAALSRRLICPWLWIEIYNATDCIILQRVIVWYFASLVRCKNMCSTLKMCMAIAD